MVLKYFDLLQSIFLDDTLDSTVEKNIVHCPFSQEHKNNDNNRSAVLFNDGGSCFFHCSSCDRSYTNIYYFYQAYRKDIKNVYATIQETKNLLKWNYKTTPNVDWAIEYEKNINELEKVANYWKFELSVLKDLRISAVGTSGKEFSVPVFVNNELIDIRTYTPDETPKWKSHWNALSGMIIPYNKIKESNKKIVFLCAGEKDMLIARSKGLNACCITGGELALPNELLLDAFKDKAVVILYDNDNTGIAGGKKLANFFLSHNIRVRNCTKFHEVCSKDKEDIYDFFVTHNKSLQLLIEYVKQTTDYKDSTTDYKDSTSDVNIDNLDILTCKTIYNQVSEYNFKRFKNTVQIVGLDAIPKVNVCYSFECFWKNDGQEIKRTATFTYNPVENPKILTDFINMGTRKPELTKYLKSALGLSGSHHISNFMFKEKSYCSVYGGVLNDYNKLNGSYDPRYNLMFFSVNFAINPSKIYEISGQAIIMDYQNQKIPVIIINDKSQVLNEINKPEINQDTKARLEKFQISYTDDLEQDCFSLRNKLFELWQRSKDINFSGDPLNQTGFKLLFFMYEFTYNTPLKIIYGSTITRCGLDITIIGDAGLGKTKLIKRMEEIYGLGMFIVMDKVSTTSVALMGGTDTVLNGRKILKEGLLSKYNGKLVVLDEYTLANDEFKDAIAAVKENNVIQSNRISASASRECYVRLIEIGNPTENKNMDEYLNGVEILQKIIGQGRSIRRTDLYGFFSREDRDMYNTEENKIKSLEMFSKETYKTRTDWIFSLKENQIKYDLEALTKYHKMLVNRYNCDYSSQVKDILTNADLKLLRLAVGVAGTVVSSNSKYTELIVKECHIKIAYDFTCSLYDTNTFQLKNTVDYINKSYSWNEKDVKELAKRLKDDKWEPLLNHLAGGIFGLSNTNINDIRDYCTGNDVFYKQAKEWLRNNKYVEFLGGYMIRITSKFRSVITRAKKENQLQTRPGGMS